MTPQDLLSLEFNGHVKFVERRPRLLQVVAPLFHEDGDMVDLFLDLPETPDGSIRISDHGMTLMRLSYSYELDTPTKRRVFDRILSTNGVSESRGRLFLDTTPESLYPALLQFAQTVAKVSNLHVLKREIVYSLFYEQLNEFISNKLQRFQPEQHFVPLLSRDDLDVDWRFPLPTRDIFLYGVRESSKARLAGLTCLEFQKMGLPFRSVIVHEDFEEGLSKKDQRRITNIADKQFATLPDFLSDAEGFFNREFSTEFHAA